MNGKKCEIWHDINLSELDKCPIDELKEAYAAEIEKLLMPAVIWINAKTLRIIDKIYNK